MLLSLIVALSVLTFISYKIDNELLNTIKLSKFAFPKRDVVEISSLEETQISQPNSKVKNINGDDLKRQLNVANEKPVNLKQKLDKTIEKDSKEEIVFHQSAAEIKSLTRKFKENTRQSRRCAENSRDTAVFRG